VPDVHVESVRPASFDQAAWDLAIATQPLSYLGADLAAR